MFGRGKKQQQVARIDQYAATVEQILLQIGIDPVQARMNISDGYG